MERTEVSAIDARKNMMIKIKRWSGGNRRTRKKRLREENGETEMERHLYTQIENIFGPSQPCMSARSNNRGYRNNGLPWRASWERCCIVVSYSG
jgi:hypothetical protein